MRRTGIPSIVAGDHALHPLRRLELSDRRIHEGDLQEALHRCPELLPVEEFDPAFAPLVSLGREIQGIDNLFISPAGVITLVETKLWRNPEATRQVVGQVLDYASRLSSWSYDKLEEKLREAGVPALVGDGTLYRLVAEACPRLVLPQAQFIDEVGKNLRNGRFLLLVVGDGIRENLEGMLAQIHDHPQMLFTFGLVEVQIYENPAAFDGRLLLPMVVAQTTEVTRAVVHVKTTGQAEVTVAIGGEEEEQQEEGSSGGHSRRKLTREMFLEETPDPRTRQLCERLLALGDEVGARPDWGSASVSIRLRDPSGSRQKLTLFVLTPAGSIYTGWLMRQLDRVSLDEHIAVEYAKALAGMFPGVEPQQKYPDSLTRAITAAELEPRLAAVESLVRETVDRIMAGVD